MIWKTVDNRIRQAFNDAALQYEVLSSLHKEIGRELVKKLIHADAATILDVGTGTGYAANKAKFFFPDSLVVGLDLSEGMLAQAKQLREGIELVQGDAEAMPFRSGAFDLIISNLAYQWALDVPKAFAQAHRILSPHGRFAATMFGHNTFKEMFESLEAGGIDPRHLKRLVSKEDIEQSLKILFPQVKMDYELIKIQFTDLRDLLNWCKSIGANRLGADVFLGKEKLQRAQEFYKSKYPYHNGIAATFEVVWVYGEKENDAQGN